MKETVGDTVKKVFEVWTMRTIGYGLVSGTVASYSGVEQISKILFGGDGIQTTETMAVLGVGGLFIFIGEFMSNYIQSLKDQSKDRFSLLMSAKDIQTSIESLSKKIETIGLDLRTTGEQYGTQGDHM